MVNPETKILQTVEEYYTNNVKTNPECNSKSVGWSTVDSQYLRFKKLNTVISDTNTNITVNDYGCGYAEHLSSLKKINGINVTYYNGYDISNEMLSSAVANLSTLKFKNYNLFNSSKIETIADFTFVSGTFNNKFDTSEEDWSNYVVDALVNINEHSRKGFSFNMLSCWVDWREPHLFYGDPLFFFKLCKEKFSIKVN